MTSRVHRKSAVATLLIALALGGCAGGQIGQDAMFTASSPTSLLMFGVELQSQYKAPDFIFRRYDERTGRVDSETYQAMPRLHQITGGQSLLEYLSGRDPPLIGHVYFTINLPPGNWFLWRVRGIHGEGGGWMQSAATTLSEGTILISSKPGAALYLGEFVLKGKYGENITLTPAPANLSAAQAELDTFRGVKVKLSEEEERRIGTFGCMQSRLVRRECEPTKIVVPIVEQ